MSSKRIITVIGLLIVGTFGYIAYTDGVSIWQNLHKQEQEIQQLNVEYEELDKELEQTVEVKEKNQEDVDELEQEKQQLEEERKKLEAELQASRLKDSRLVFDANKLNGWT